MKCTGRRNAEKKIVYALQHPGVLLGRCAISEQKDRDTQRARSLLARHNIDKKGKNTVQHPRFDRLNVSYSKREYDFYVQSLDKTDGQQVEVLY